MQNRILPALLLSCATLAIGCADEAVATDTSRVLARPSATLVDGSVTVDKKFADAVQVTDDRLVIASAGQEKMLAKIEVGTIVASDRATAKPGVKSTNPYGFLRRVTAIKISGKDTILSTKKAELSEWIQDGRLDFSSTRSMLDPKAKLAPGGAVTKALQLQDAKEGKVDGETAAASTPIEASLDSVATVSNANLALNAGFQGYFDVHTKGWGPAKIPTGASFESILTLDPTLSADLTLSLTSASKLEKSWTGPEVTIPIGGPVPITLSFAPELKCTIEAGGSLTAVIGVNVTTHLVIGFDGDAGLTSANINNRSQNPTASATVALKSITGRASVSARCEVVAIPKLLVFDAIGIGGRIGPYEKLTGDLCVVANTGGSKSAFTLGEEHGLTYHFTGNVQVPIFDYKLAELDLLSAADIPADGGEQYLVGNADSCTAPAMDSCAGRADGQYCSEIDPVGAFACSGGVVSGGEQCAAAGKCKSGKKSGTTTCG